MSEHEGSIAHRKHLQVALADLDTILNEARYLRDRFVSDMEASRQLAVDMNMLVDHIEALVKFSDPDKTPDPSEAGTTAQSEFELTKNDHLGFASRSGKTTAGGFRPPEPDPPPPMPERGNYRPPSRGG